MARRRIEQLRDDVIVAARMVAADVDADDSANRTYGVDELVTALDRHDAHLQSIVDSPGQWVNGAPGTSRSAAMLVVPMSGSIRRQIVEEVYSVHRLASVGLTDNELERRLRGKHQTVSSARNWLVEAGWLRPSGFTRQSESKRDQIVWTLTTSAFEAVRSQAMKERTA